ncbi:MAG: hypothetical protein WDA22_04060 [Bacteroidota bacterium]
MKKTSSAFLLFLILFTGCAEKPKSVGNGLPNPDGIFSIADTTFYSMGDTTYRVAFPTGSGLSNLVGRISSTEEVVSLIQFIPGGAIDSLKGARIDTAEFRLTVNYQFKPTTLPVSLNIVEVQKSWSQITFTFDSLPSLIFGTKTLGTFSDSMKFASIVKALLDTVEVRKWANSYIDSAAPDFFGFAVQPPTGVTNGVIGFSTFDNFTSFVPQLFIRFTKNGKRDSLTVITGQDTYASKYTGSTPFSPIMVRAGFGIRSKLNFDLSALKDKPIVNNATLELTLDSAASIFGGYSPDTLTALLGMSNTIVDRSDSTVFVYGVKKTSIAGVPQIYAFRLTDIADRWVRNVLPNYGLTIRWAAEYGTVEKAVFYSNTNADITKRPKLKMTYAKK